MLARGCIGGAICLVLAVFGCDRGASKNVERESAPSGAQSKETSNVEPQSTPDAAIEAIDRFIAEQDLDKSKPGWKTSLPKPPQVEFDSHKTYFWHIKTNKGSVKIKLLPDVAPMHVSSTIYLTRLGFYDGLAFHRVIPGFMAQGGCPLGTGSGGPGYKYAGEFSPEVRHDRKGLLSMANAGPGTDGSQFFLTFKETPWLDDKHTLFGEVVEGEETLTALEYFGSQSGRPTTTLTMEQCTISVQ